MPTINEFELALAAKVLDITNPGRSSANHIQQMVNSNWPFHNISTGGWVAYAEAPGRNENVRIALTPYSMTKYLDSQDALF